MKTKVREPEVEQEKIAFEFKLKDQTDWPLDFVKYIRSIIKLEEWSYRKTENGILVTLPPKALFCLQGWLELRGLSPADEERFL